MELGLLNPECDEWNYIWNWIEEHPLNKDLDEPRVAENNGNAWEYMGSYLNGKKAIHSFRHISHPKTNEMVKLSVSSSDNYTKENILKKFKIN